MVLGLGNKNYSGIEGDLGDSSPAAFLKLRNDLVGPRRDETSFVCKS